MAILDLPDVNMHSILDTEHCVAICMLETLCVLVAIIYAYTYTQLTTVEVRITDLHPNACDILYLKNKSTLDS